VRNVVTWLWNVKAPKTQQYHSTYVQGEKMLSDTAFVMAEKIDNGPYLEFQRSGSSLEYNQMMQPSGKPIAILALYEPKRFNDEWLNARSDDTAVQERSRVVGSTGKNHTRSWSVRNRIADLPGSSMFWREGNRPWTSPSSFRSMVDVILEQDSARMCRIEDIQDAHGRFLWLGFSKWWFGIMSRYFGTIYASFWRILLDVVQFDDTEAQG